MVGRCPVTRPYVQMVSSYPDAPTHFPRSALHRRNQNAAPKSIAKLKATSREPPRTSVSSPRTFVPLLTTEGFRILLPKSFQRERTCPMKLGIFILLLVNQRPGGVSYVRGVEKSATPFDDGI